MPETLDLTINLPVNASDAHRAVRTGRDDGPVHARRIGDAGLGMWEVHLTEMHAGHVARLWDLWAKTKEGSLSMLWTPPGGSQTTVRFSDPVLEIVQVSGVYYACRFRIAEVRT